MVWVLHLCGRLSVGGVQAVLMSFYKNIDRNKVQFAFAVQRNFEYEYDKEILKMGGRIHYLPDMFDDKKAYKVALNELLSEHREYKIVHSHFNHKNWELLRIAKKNHIPVRISHAHAANEKKRLTTKIHLNLLSLLIRFYATRLLSCSNASGEYLYNTTRFELLKNAINIDDFVYDPVTRLEFRRSLDIHDTQIAIVQVGHINENKNQLFTIEVLKQLPEKYKLFIVGDGDAKTTLENKIQKLGLDSRVVFLGVRNDVGEILQAMDIMMFPSKHEGLGVVCVESQTAGLMTFASDCVPSEVEITHLVKRLPLSKIDDWVRTIYEYNINERKNMANDIRNAGYDIAIESKRLQDIYISSLEG